MFDSCSAPSTFEVAPYYIRAHKTDEQYEFKGVPLFIDVGGLLETPPAYKAVLDMLIARYTREKLDIQGVAMFDSRGFLFGPQIAQALGVPCVMLRKKGKLPGQTISVTYGTEYSTDTLSVNVASVKPGQRFLLVDDILATGGTLAAGAQLIRALGGEVAECCVVVALDFLGGADKFHNAAPELKETTIFTLLSTDDVPPPPEGHSAASVDAEVGTPEFEALMKARQH